MRSPYVVAGCPAVPAALIPAALLLAALGCGDDCPDVANGSGLGVDLVPAVAEAGEYRLDVTASDRTSTCRFDLPDLARLDCSDARLRLDVSPAGSLRGFLVTGRHDLVAFRITRGDTALVAGTLEPSYDSTGSTGCGASFNANERVEVP